MIYNDSKDKLKIEFGNRVRQARLDHALSVEKLAGNVGVSTQTIKQIERGERFCKIDVLVGLAVSLGVSADFLLALKDKHESEDLLIMLSSLDDKQIKLIQAMIEAMKDIWGG